MKEMEDKISEFFAQYEARVNSALEDTPEVDAEATAEAFSDGFIAANPGGVNCGNYQLQIN